MLHRKVKVKVARSVHPGPVAKNARAGKLLRARALTAQALGPSAQTVIVSRAAEGARLARRTLVQLDDRSSRQGHESTAKVGTHEPSRPIWGALFMKCI
jgi:hypothetical protein